ncbi:complex I subunit 4 family protein [Tautonia plasticadhaerens]|uniref:NAD(P)H-quinone oxidoreductase chain 4 1 n=1 Tax=Tautonia plasticadhaerens TaxID=2527974 RepID=A0A518GY59_9BACT|nr:NADH-quinone oxidoreductase subunit M [Tautonia plasticadhaerens]QDV33529.1 NAD(P)H-quinone oxidoreductase chain 4 1 [Tautonia plasticadhaerens]
MSDNLLLSMLWAVPLVGSVLVLFLPARNDLAVKATALAITVLTFVLALVAFQSFLAAGSVGVDLPLSERAERNTLTVDEVTGSIAVTDEPGDFVYRGAWISYFNVQYFLGLDGISMSLVLLTGLISLLACLASWGIDRAVKGYFSLFLLLLSSMLGVFLALDLFLFFVFFEFMLLPMYFLIGIWGGERREYAAIKFLLYTLFGSVFILVAILILYFYAPEGGEALHSFDALRLMASSGHFSGTIFGFGVQSVVFALFLIGFLIKLPAVPFHTWLPDAHVQAPTPISMILAGVLLKVGGYGLIRLAWPLAPIGAYELSWTVAVLGVVGILYGALAAMAQTDFKRLVAYSSVSHMGYVTLGLAVMNLVDPRYYAYGVNGAMFMMVAHGITSAGMFFLVGVVYDRLHTRDLDRLGGLMDPMPVYGGVTMLIFFGSMGLPGLCGFVAEVFVVLSAFNYSYGLAVLAAAAVVLTAGYILWTIQRVLLGRNEAHRGLPDLSTRELVIAAPLVVLTVWLGIFPQTLLGWMSPSVDHMVATVAAANGIEPGEAAAIAVEPEFALPR